TFANPFRGGAHMYPFAQRTFQIFQRLRGFQQLERLTGKLNSCFRLEPFRAVVGRFRQQLIQIDGYWWVSLAARANCPARSICNVQFESHDGLVDRSDLLNIQSSVVEAVAVEDQKFSENIQNGAVRNMRNVSMHVGGR